MKQNFKDYVERIVPYKPGKPIEEVERELGLKNVIKLASNENALGPSPKALRAMRRAIEQVHQYPEGGCSVLRSKLANSLSLNEQQFIIGNGSNEIIELLARGFLREGDRVVSSETSFLVYPMITQIVGAQYTAVPMKGMRFDLQGIIKAIDDRTRLIFIANPNNPTGTYVKATEVLAFLSKLPDHVVVCFDEAYLDFVEARDFPKLIDEVKRGRPNLILLRTFSKSYGLAGLRIGYGVGSENMIGYLQKARQPFNVNHVAQAAAQAALGDTAFLERTKKLAREGKYYLYQRLTAMELEYVPSEANFILINVKRDSRRVFEALLKRGVIVRPMNGYGLKSYIRVTYGKRAELDKFLKALQSVMKEGNQ